MLAGIPLVEHSLRLAAMCPEIDRTIVSTDSQEIAEVARAAGADVPFLRPSELAGDETPMLPVLRHALEQADASGTALRVPPAPRPDEPGAASRRRGHGA